MGWSEDAASGPSRPGGDERVIYDATHPVVLCGISQVTIEDEWLWGWDETPGIVSVWAEPDGRAYVWRRVGGHLVREDARFRPWLVLASLEDLMHLGPRLRPEPPEGAGRAAANHVTYTELSGPGALRWLVRAGDGMSLAQAVVYGASRRLGRSFDNVRDIGQERVISLAPEEQYLMATGRTYFRDIGFDDLRRMQFDLETTGLDPAQHRIFLIALRDPDGNTEILEVREQGDAGERDLLHRFLSWVRACDPDVIENHNLHGFALPLFAHRARVLGVPLAAVGPTTIQSLSPSGAPGCRGCASERPRAGLPWGPTATCGACATRCRAVS